MSNKDKKANTEPWEKHFMALVDYKAKHGDFNITSEHDVEKNPYARLYNWCVNQRDLYRRKVLQEDRVQRLSAIGFSWKGYVEISFDTRMRELAEYKAKYGHCIVSRQSPGYISLGNWVKEIRKSYDKKTLSQAKIDKLNAIGFVWRVRAQRSDHRDLKAAAAATATATGDAADPPPQSPTSDPTPDKTNVQPTTSDAAPAPAAAAVNATPPPKKKRKQAIQPHNPLLDGAYIKLNEVLAEISCPGDWGDWVV